MKDSKFSFIIFFIITFVN